MRCLHLVRSLQLAGNGALYGCEGAAARVVLNLGCNGEERTVRPPAHLCVAQVTFIGGPRGAARDEQSESFQFSDGDGVV